MARRQMSPGAASTTPRMASLALFVALTIGCALPALANCPTEPCPDPATQYFDCRAQACDCIDHTTMIDPASGKCIPKCPKDQKPIPLQTMPYKCVCKKQGQKPDASGKCVYAPPPASPSPPPPSPPPPACVKTPCPDPSTQHFDCIWGMCICNDNLYTLDKDGKCVPKCPDDQSPTPPAGMKYTCTCKLAGQSVNPTTGKCEYPSPPPVASPPPSASPPPPCVTHSEGSEGEEGREGEGFHSEGEEGESEGEDHKPPPCVVTPPPAPKCAKKGESCKGDLDCCKYEDCGSYLKCDNWKCNEKPPPAPKPLPPKCAKKGESCKGDLDCCKYEECGSYLKCYNWKCNEQPPPSPKAPPPPPKCGQPGAWCLWDKDCCSYGECGKYLKCKWWKCQE